MAERKVLNKYFAPNFDPSLLVRRKHEKNKIFNVRMMLPMTMCCNTCGTYNAIATKYNMRLEKVLDENYLGIKIFRFYYKCTTCYAEHSFKTDPKNSDYVAELGATRSYDPNRDLQQAEQALKDKRVDEEEGDTMQKLVNRTYDSKREMDILEALDEVRHLNKRQMSITPEEMLAVLERKRNSSNSALQQQLQQFNEDEEKMIQDLFRKKVKRIEEEHAADDCMFDQFGQRLVSGQEAMLKDSEEVVLDIDLQQFTKKLNNPAVKEETEEVQEVGADKFKEENEVDQQKEVQKNQQNKKKAEVKYKLKIKKSNENRALNLNKLGGVGLQKIDNNTTKIQKNNNKVNVCNYSSSDSENEENN